ncbi:MAG: rhomboid family intramembrane serine protease [Lachnospiraceae bacterium]|nr:rhomboid family intramembrane serine protease [Lachnospiraceae bacterium]
MEYGNIEDRYDYTKSRRSIPVMTILFAGINIFIWILLELSGDTTDAYFMAERGAAYSPFIIEDHEWWRLFTCTFLHFGAEHLMNNVLMLVVLGMRLEHAIGKLGFSILYLSSGLSGSLLSLWAEVKFDDLGVTAGASGSVFGIVGGLVALAVWNRGKVEGLTTIELLFLLGFSLFFGFVEGGVDNWGHIGGILGGLVVGSILAILKKIDFMNKSKYTIE